MISNGLAKKKERKTQREHAKKKARKHKCGKTLIVGTTRRSDYGYV